MTNLLLKKVRDIKVESLKDIILMVVRVEGFLELKRGRFNVI
jgi:hypothetical protein